MHGEPEVRDPSRERCPAFPGRRLGRRLAGATALTAPPPTARAFVSNPAAHALRVLIVDDQAPIRMALVRFGKRRGWEMAEAVDGAAALVLLTQGGAPANFDAILCDLRMPGVDGVQLFAALKERRPELTRRIAFTTGDSSDAAAAAFLAECGCPSLEKPFDLDHVAAVVEALAQQ